MRALSEGIADASWLDRLGARLHEVAWVLSHWDDLDADFLAIYGIDLEDCDLSGPRFFARAHRLSAYTGVMQARVEEGREEADDRPVARETPEAPGGTDQHEVDLTAMRMQFPGLVSMAAAAEGGGG